MAKAKTKVEKPKAKRGRPSGYSPEIAAELCARIAAGESLRTACKADGMPPMATVFLWLHKHQDFMEQYERATAARSHAFVEEMIDIADNGANDWMEANDPDNPGYRLNGEAIQRSRLRVDTRKWNAARMQPKRYGDKIDHHVEGGISIQVLTGVPDGK